MSKKLNVSGNNNTLFKYFSRSPAPAKKIQPETSCKNDEKENVENCKELSKNEDALKPTDGSEEVVAKKRRRILIEEESEDEAEQNESSLFEGGDSDEYQPSDESESESDASEVLDHEEDSLMTEGSDEEERPLRKKGIKINDRDGPKTKKLKLETTVSGNNFMDRLSNWQKDQKDADEPKESEKKHDTLINIIANPLSEPAIWPHQKYEFLQPENIRDKMKRRPDHPDYDPNTLHVPENFLSKQSPGLRQWWSLKSENFQCVLFFKLGKFYELYHMDADVGVNELGFIYMKGEFAHSGFPEISYDKMSSILIDRGYKVARIEQTETPDMMQERFKNMPSSKTEKKGDKVVRREVCQISSRGVQVFGTQCQITPNYEPNYMLAIVEKEEGNFIRYGISFIDTSIGDFYLGEFVDDNNCSRLLTLLSHHKPVLVVYEKNSLSQITLKVMRTSLSGVTKEFLPNNGSQRCSAEKTLKHLAEKYFCLNGNTENNWPVVLRTMQCESDHLGLTPSKDYTLTLKALGLCISYINKCHVEEKVLPMARYNMYQPPDIDFNTNENSQKIDTKPRQLHMVLDAVTLNNLRINNGESSLFATLDNCCTKFGKRHLYSWLCSPSCNVEEIAERQSAISELIANETKLEKVRSLLAPMPDFERYLAQIHLFGNKIIMDNHPDGRAILFEESSYNKKKIRSFTATLKGFKELMKVSCILSDMKSPLIKRITQVPKTGGIYPDMQELLHFFENSFDHAEANNTGTIAPEKGVDADYDECQAKIDAIKDELAEYLIEQEKFFGCRITYFGSDKKRFQLEIPESHAKKATSEYNLEGQKKGKNPTRRFTTNKSKSLLKKMLTAEDERNTILKDISRRIFEKFSKHYDIWKKAIDCVAYLDVLSSLAEYARQQIVVCVPEVSGFSDTPFIEIENGYHPCVKSDSYIPNGITLGTSGNAALSLLTGPNMGGKSTLMRQVGCLIVMAQIGAHVPASSCRLSIADRIFTRLGAHDDIIAGQSTFLVELNETSLILKHATRHSIVLLDELGRGTATYDGTAIAASVVQYLAELKCRSLFSTHYHNLVDYFHNHENVSLGHMACMVENEDKEDPTEETVTFLYKYSPGACPKSYGFNAAKLAGMPRPIIKRSYELSKEVEAIALKRKIAAHIIRSAVGGVDDYTTVKNLFSLLKSCQI